MPQTVHMNTVGVLSIFSQSPAVKPVNDEKTGEHYTFSIATGKRATIEEAAVDCKKEDSR